MRQRTGYTLIEMMVALTGSAVLMGIAVTLLCALLRAEGTGRAIIERTASLGRLTDQFRHDVHAAKTAARLRGNEGLTLRMPAVSPGRAEDARERGVASRSVEYVVEGAAVKRLERTAGRLSAQDRYELGDGCTAKLETTAVDGGTLIGLVIASKDSASSGNRSLRVEAALGWDHRFAETRAESN